MDKSVASQILIAATSLDKGLGEIDSLLNKIDDESERKDFAQKLGEVIGLINYNLIRPIVRIYPDLDPDK